MYNDKRNHFIDVIKTRVPNFCNLSDDEKFILLLNEHSRAFGKYVRDLFLYRKRLIYV